jgi:hypothetical protein
MAKEEEILKANICQNKFRKFDEFLARHYKFFFLLILSLSSLTQLTFVWIVASHFSKK